ncbi:MAG TPA: hypothetical protein VFW46_22005 [Stellaceae bacterium]|nr:hypothetical protein [Stellaceae bacterium]
MTRHVHDDVDPGESPDRGSQPQTPGRAKSACRQGVVRTEKQMGIRNRKIGLVKNRPLEGHARLKPIGVEQHGRRIAVAAGELGGQEHIEKRMLVARADPGLLRGVDMRQQKARILVDAQVEREIETSGRDGTEGLQTVDRRAAPPRPVFGEEIEDANIVGNAGGARERSIPGAAYQRDAVAAKGAAQFLQRGQRHQEIADVVELENEKASPARRCGAKIENGQVSVPALAPSHDLIARHARQKRVIRLARPRPLILGPGLDRLGQFSSSSPAATPPDAAISVIRRRAATV